VTRRGKLAKILDPEKDRVLGRVCFIDGERDADWGMASARELRLSIVDDIDMLHVRMAALAVDNGQQCMAGTKSTAYLGWIPTDLLSIWQVAMKDFEHHKMA
jgi:hypothetical protein